MVDTTNAIPSSLPTALRSNGAPRRGANLASDQIPGAQQMAPEHDDAVTGPDERRGTAGSFTALTPLAFLERSADVFADKTAIAYGDRRVSYSEFGAEATRLAHALRASGVQRGDRVAYLCPNIPEMLVANFGVPLAGAVLVPINTRLSAEEVRYICDHSGAKLLVVDTEYLPALVPVLQARPAERRRGRGRQRSARAGPARRRTARAHLLRRAPGAGFGGAAAVVGRRRSPGLISINYTSGTTGTPKGVMYAHRGAYLNALGEIIHQRFDPESVYLWTLPMFHCSGWCTPWAVTAIGATHVCLRAVRPGRDLAALRRGAGDPPRRRAHGADDDRPRAAKAHLLERELVATVAGAPPSATVITRMRERGRGSCTSTG